jgi:hypothetical protein
MATQKGSVHAVGNLNSSQVVTIGEVKAGASLENYTLVELSYNGSGERVANYLSDITKTGYLACAVEVLYDSEQLKEYYIGSGEYFRTVHIQRGLRFETSSYTGTPVNGQFAHFDPATKKFVVDGAVASATAKNNFLIVDANTAEYGFGLPTVRLEAL